MAGDGSAYRVLGVDPGADSSEIEFAYRRLIKQHHPDRDGGNSVRAAEINRAYRELRAVRTLKDPFELEVEEERTPRTRATRLLALASIAGSAALLFFPIALFPSQRRQPEPVRAKIMPPANEPMNLPLSLAAIDRSALDALRLRRTGDELALAATSRNCHQLLRSKPSMLQLDRCAAFDDAVVQLEDRDPLRDQGPFSQLAVSGRLWSGATTLSDDSMAIDTRFDRIRLRVELTLANAESGPVGLRKDQR